MTRGASLAFVERCSTVLIARSEDGPWKALQAFERIRGTSTATPSHRVDIAAWPDFEDRDDDRRAGTWGRASRFDRARSGSTDRSLPRSRPEMDATLAIEFSSVVESLQGESCLFEYRQ